MKIYVVGDLGPEHNSIKSIHRTYNGAFKSWNELRLKLLHEYTSMNNAEDKDWVQEAIKNLSCEDP